MNDRKEIHVGYFHIMEIKKQPKQQSNVKTKKNMSQIKTQTENTKGLHQRYFVQKIVKNPDYLNKITDTFMGVDSTPEFLLKPCDAEAEYFILRLDKNGSDPKHIEACRKAVLAYAVNIEPHLPELAKDLIERYSENHFQ